MWVHKNCSDVDHVYWNDDTQAEYSTCWVCGSPSRETIPRLFTRDTQHVMTFSETVVPG